MADGHHRAPEAAHVVLQPLHRVEVQVIGGLVQQEDIRVLQDETAQVHPGLLPPERLSKSWERMSGGMDRPLATCPRRCPYRSRRCPRTWPPAPVPAECGLCVVPGGHVPGQFLHLLASFWWRAKAVWSTSSTVYPAGYTGIWEMRPPGSPWTGPPPLVRLQLAGEDPEEGGLARAVAAQQAHPLPGLHLEGDDRRECCFLFKGLFSVRLR